MNRLTNLLPITRIKLFVAKVLYNILRLLCRGDRHIVTRNNIKYELDLSEGIDLSIFLFGNYQRHVSKNKYLALAEDAVVFDVGANIGAMTLVFAKQILSGRVYAFEPTSYAFSKLKKNLQLNPELAERITAIQSFVSSVTSNEHNIKAYASWNLEGFSREEKHPVHGGVEKSADGIGAISLDDFSRQSNMERLDLIKIDTDGHELEVLRGAQKVIARFSPVIIFEIGLYLIQERGVTFSDYLSFFQTLDYCLLNSGNYKIITADNYHNHIPANRTTDILAVPFSRLHNATG